MAADRLALYTVVYPGVEPYLAAWHQSVRQQGDQDFDLWISVDGLRRDQVIAAIGEELDARWCFASAGSSPAALRSLVLKEMVRMYAGVVLVDSDDVLEASRVSAARAGLEAADVVGCALRIADAAAQPLGPVLTPGDPCPDWADLLARHNVFGLSNTAYRTGVLDACLPLPPETRLIDWLLALRAWSAGARLRFDPVPRMIYRQHDANTARVLPPFSEETVLQATDLVLDHYERVLGPRGGIPAERQERLQHAWDDAQAFARCVRTEPARRRAYLEALNALEPRFVWWWCVANPLLEDVWKN
jgi:hypothetical protein